VSHLSLTDREAFSLNVFLGLFGLALLIQSEVIGTVAGFVLLLAILLPRE